MGSTVLTEPEVNRKGLESKVSRIKVQAMADLPTLEQITETIHANPQVFFSAGPVVGAMLLQKLFAKSKAIQMAIFFGAAGASIRILIGPHMDQVSQHWQELQALLGITQ
jgi:hypothetical protein